MAGIVVEAESESELNNILLALGNALASYGSTSRPQFSEEKTRR